MNIKLLKLHYLTLPVFVVFLTPYIFTRIVFGVSYIKSSPIVEVILIGIAVIGGIATFLLYFLCWRCNKCHAYLGRDVKRFCSSCGNDLKDVEIQIP